MNYILYGEEQYRLKKTLQTIIREYAADEQDLNVVRYDARESVLTDILEDAATVPFFAEHKVIVVEHADFLSAQTMPGYDMKLLEAYIGQPCETTVLIFSGSFAKLDARKKAVKLMKQTWRVLEFRKLDEPGKQSIVQEELAQRRIQIEPAALQELLRRLPLDMETIHRELDKLELYGEAIGTEALKQLVSRPLEENVFQLVDAVVCRDKRKAFSIWQDLCVVNTEPIYLISLIAGQLRFLFEVKQLLKQGKGKEEIAGILSAHPYRVKLALKQASSLSLSYLMEMLARLAELDQKLKGGLLDKKLGFELFLLEL